MEEALLIRARPATKLSGATRLMRAANGAWPRSAKVAPTDAQRRVAYARLRGDKPLVLPTHAYQQLLAASRR
jgi:hypothetical protein